MSQSKTTSSRDRPSGAGGRRLSAAFDTVAGLPALAEARRRLIGLCEGSPRPGELTAAVEADVGLAIAVMRAANNGGGSDQIGGVGEAVEELRADRVAVLARDLETYDVLNEPGNRSERHERFRRHGVAVRVTVGRIAAVSKLPQRDELAIAALLHDIGKPVLAELYGDEHLSPLTNGRGESPDEWVRNERRELGIDHALVGAVLIRRWGLSTTAATAIERHHARDAEGHAAAIRLADLIVHHVTGDPVSVDSMREAAGALEIDAAGLDALIFEYPYAGERRRRTSEHCPLSARELDALRGLGEGKVYKQIAQELSLSVSTVRTHLHNVYRKIGAVDRAQAVLIARDRGWL
jgi:putative nucleotidyltransferase with HDIG domain